MIFYLSAEVLRHGKAIIFENNARMVCICPFFVVTLQAENETSVHEKITRRYRDDSPLQYPTLPKDEERFFIIRSCTKQ